MNIDVLLLRQQVINRVKSYLSSSTDWRLANRKDYEFVHTSGVRIFQLGTFVYCKLPSGEELTSWATGLDSLVRDFIKAKWEEEKAVEYNLFLSKEC